MRQVLVLSAFLLLGACASEGTFSREAPQEPGVLPPPHAREQTVPSAGPLRLARVGSYMDAQERDFRTHLKGFPVRRVGDDLVVSIDDGLLFEDRELSDHGCDTLETIARLLRHYDRSYVQVLGYTDTWAPRIQALHE
jgi:outer membrane protein OmpA-like peptidoglycan-associated protein